MERALLRLMLDPQSYADPSRLASAAPGVPGPSACAALNRWLLCHYRVPPRAPGPLAPSEQVLVHAWPHLRRAAYLLGAWQLRATVLREIGYLRCDPGVRRFIALPLPLNPLAPPRAPLDDSLLLYHGLRVLQPWLDDAGAAWHARVALLFPAAAAQALALPGGAPLNLSCIQLALHYAKNS